MTAPTLFYYGLAVAGSLLAIGGAAWCVFCLFVGLIGWSKKPSSAPPPKSEP